jgi:hypothetical protein
MYLWKGITFTDRDWTEDYGTPSCLGGLSCQKCAQSYMAAKRRKLCRRCFDERELERLQKEQARLDETTAATVAVAHNQKAFELLLGLHKNAPQRIDWTHLACALASIPPTTIGLVCRASWRKRRISRPEDDPPQQPSFVPSADAASEYEHARAAWDEARKLALSILKRDTSAYVSALERHATLHALSPVGIDLEVTETHPDRVAVVIHCRSDKAIPSVTRTLTATGKLSEKPIPRARHQEVYQDHICSAILRVAREFFSVLPITHILITCRVPVGDGDSDAEQMVPVYSLLMDRSQVEILHYQSLDPSDAVESFQHRGDFKASRQAGAFQSIAPFTFAYLPQSQQQDGTLAGLRAKAAELRNELLTFVP